MCFLTRQTQMIFVVNITSRNFRGALWRRLPPEHREGVIQREGGGTAAGLRPAARQRETPSPRPAAATGLSPRPSSDGAGWGCRGAGAAGMLPEDGSKNERTSEGTRGLPASAAHPRPPPPPAGRSGARRLPAGSAPAGGGSSPGSPRARPAAAPAPLRRDPRPPPGAAAARGRRLGRQPPGVSRAPGRAPPLLRPTAAPRGARPGKGPSPASPPPLLPVG